MSSLRRTLVISTMRGLASYCPRSNAPRMGCARARRTTVRCPHNTVQRDYLISSFLTGFMQGLGTFHIDSTNRLLGLSAGFRGVKKKKGKVCTTRLSHILHLTCCICVHYHRKNFARTFCSLGSLKSLQP